MKTKQRGEATCPGSRKAKSGTKGCIDPRPAPAGCARRPPGGTPAPPQSPPSQQSQRWEIVKCIQIPGALSRAEWAASARVSSPRETLSLRSSPGAKVQPWQLTPTKAYSPELTEKRCPTLSVNGPSAEFWVLFAVLQSNCLHDSNPAPIALRRVYFTVRPWLKEVRTLVQVAPMASEGLRFQPGQWP